MFNKNKNDIIKNYVFNTLKRIKINKIDPLLYKETLRSTKDPSQRRFFFRYFIRKEVEIFTDELTYLFNKRFYSKFIMPFCMQKKDSWNNLKKFWNSPVLKNKDKVFYMLIDIGNFKKINDNYSYKTGDYLLRTFGYFLIKERIDFAIRNGGDEFVLIIPSIKKTISLLKKFEDIAFIKNLNYNSYSMHLINEEIEEINKIVNENNIVYIGAGFKEINLSKIRKYIQNKNLKAYQKYIRHIELSATEYMKKNKSKIKNNINITSYRD